ncbi:hypothetical protein PHJA_001696600, partial [Phtheirospermum japonicum]
SFTHGPHKPSLLHSRHHFPGFHTHLRLRRLLHRLQTQGPKDLHQRRLSLVLLRRQLHRQLQLLPIRHRQEPQPCRILSRQGGARLHTACTSVTGCPPPNRPIQRLVGPK